MPFIKVIDLKKEYVNDALVTPVLRGVSFAIERGDFVSIMGPSGSGKSTLMHILGFLDTLTAGEYWFDGQDVSTLPSDALAAMRQTSVGFVFQAFNLLPRLSALENVMLPLVYSRVPPAERLERATQLLDSVGLGQRRANTPAQLSGGEKQRVAIARALVNRPAVILADEPTGNLDSKSGLQVMQLLQGLHRAGHTVILVTHERYTASFANRIFQMKDGEIVADELNGHRLAEASPAGLVK